MTANGTDTAWAVAAAVRSGRQSARVVVEAALARIDAVDKDVGAFLTVTPAAALAAADSVDAAVAAGADPGPLAGVPVAVKDNLCTAGTATTAASKILQGFMPPYDATVVARLRAAGAIIVGKTNLDEFAMGSTTESSAFQATRNPWDLTRVPGGSSGGSAAAVAARLVPLALGSDTGGSVRQPAALCGVVGLRPTYGRISRYGLIPMAASMDVVGPITTDVLDCILAMTVLAGPDRRDATSGPAPAKYWLSTAARADGDLQGLRIGVPAQFFDLPMEEPVRVVLEQALDQLVALGARLEPCSLPQMQHALAAYYALVSGEASSGMGRYDGVRYGLRVGAEQGMIGMYEQSRGAGFGVEVKRRILFGTHLLSDDQYERYYRQAQRLRRLIKDELAGALDKFDLLAAPVAAATARPLEAGTGKAAALYAGDFLTLPASLAGTPALSIPCGFAGGLPVGLQLLGKTLDEATVLRTAAVYQRVTDHHRQLPPTTATGGAATSTAVSGSGGGEG